MSTMFRIGTLALLVAAAMPSHAGESRAGDERLVVTASNGASNQLLVYSSEGTLLRTIATGGQGGVSGNAGGIASSHHRLAVVNYGSGNVSLFVRDEGNAKFHLVQLLTTVDKPVSVTFGAGHLYVLSATHVESHALTPLGVKAAPDGVALLVKADGSAAQVGVLNDQLIISEKSNAIETVNLSGGGAIVGATSLVAGIPANVNAPFGLATRGNNAYVTIAHADEISLVRNDNVLTTTGSGTQHAPCWVTLDGPYLFSANSPSKSVSRYVVYGQNVIQDAAVVAQFSSSPTDIDYKAGLAAVIDANGSVSHVSIFEVDDDGNLTPHGVATINGTSTNGVAVIERDDFDD